MVLNIQNKNIITISNVHKSCVLKPFINPIRLFSPTYINPNITNIDIPYNAVTIIYASIFDVVLFILITP